MSDYFDEMGWRQLGEGERQDRFMDIARMLTSNLGISEPLNQNTRLPPPASKSAVENLKEVEIESTDKKDCSVCLKEFTVGTRAKHMPCKHIFHKECIIPWLEKTNSCPVCRYQLPTDDEEYEKFRKEQRRAIEREHDLETLHNSMFL